MIALAYHHSRFYFIGPLRLYTHKISANKFTSAAEHFLSILEANMAFRKRAASIQAPPAGFHMISFEQDDYIMFSHGAEASHRYADFDSFPAAFDGIRLFSLTFSTIRRRRVEYGCNFRCRAPRGRFQRYGSSSLRRLTAP